MSHTKTLSAVMMIMALASAPALAQRTEKPTRDVGHQPMVTEAGASVPFMLHHAYTEAVRASQAEGMGMSAMAKNHFENVRMSLEEIARSRTLTDPGTKRTVEQLKERATELASNPSVEGGQQLVAQFSTFVLTAPKAMMKGTAHKMQGEAAMHTPADLVAMAQEAVVNTQVDSAMQDFKGATLSIQQAITALDAARQSAKAANLPSDQIREIDNLSTAVRKISVMIERKSPDAAAEAANLVQQFSQELPNMQQSSAARLSQSE
jgi:hypothetical protein